MRRNSPGNTWRDATGEFAMNVPVEMDSRYGQALDLLACKVQSHIWDCNGGIWEPRSGDAVRHRLSLAWLGRLLVTECEQARLPRDRTRPTLSRRLTAAKRRKLVKDMRSVAKVLRAGSPEIFMATFAASKHVVPSPASDDPIPAGLLPMEMRAWLKSQRRLTSSRLGDALLAIAGDLDGIDHRRKPLGRREQPETTLAAALVTWLRAATGGPYSYQRGEPIPTGGRPFYEVVVAFVKAAGWSMTDSLLKSRLEARQRA
jgi:hypothetical protein